MFINNDDIGKTSMTGWFYDFEIICEYQSIKFTYSMNRIIEQIYRWIVFIISIINYEGNIDKKLQTLSISLSFVVKKILNDMILLLIVILRVKMYNNPVLSQILNRYKSAW